MYKHLLIFKCFLMLTIVGSAQTCDLNLVGYTPPATGSGLHTFVVNFINAENCGCNEYTQSDGNYCDLSSSPTVQNNDNVSHIVFGLHYVNEETGEDYGENTDCTSTTYHPGWSYVVYSNTTSSWVTGASTTFAINPPFSWDCILENPIEGYCWEVVIWQINLSQTADINDFPTDGWSSGVSFDQTQMYPDIDLSNNTIQFCPETCDNDTVYVELPNDTITEYITDTVYVELPPEIITEYVYDTITQYINLYDTLYIDNYIFDTTYVDVIVDNYIYITDTITEIILQEIWIDCLTGLECSDEPPGFDCGLSQLFVPNTFTPNNDGLNDVWGITYESECWVDIRFDIYNRWGNLVFSGYGEDFWDGSLNGGSYYVPDGVYTYTLKGRKNDYSEWVSTSGHITLLR